MQRSSYWERVVAEGYRVPQGEALDELTTELVAMLGERDPHVREDIAYSVLHTWISEGVYDHLLGGLGDGLAYGLRDSGGADDLQAVLRRSYSALTLGAVVARDNLIYSLSPTVVLTWADYAVAWFLSEKDLRGWVPEVGWVHAITHGADLIATLTASRHLGTDELTVLLDVIAERLLKPADRRFDGLEDQRLAFATMSLLHRDLVPTETLEAWLERLAERIADSEPPTSPESPNRANITAYLRALHLQLLLGVHGTPAQDASATPHTPPAARSDLLIALQNALRAGSPWLYRQAVPLSPPPPRPTR
ncbi:DUF2785 domain-containing protein [Phytoactinopolyspora halotolerans]|uniref:DUF2785 domain-containing protein n=1 Tax=Phytoactinopolyspora halotolerans TaxID=1981512 RepID=UPI001C208A92|nr:DUF2785 domain-containing protein [Phytoactinopolyspora halotolerans]